jgi:glycine/D-amino acid oxidase-like deaminating enzyme
MRHAPFWSDRVSKSRRVSFPRLRGEQSTRVAIVGGGLTGAACAVTFAAAGVDVVLLEAEAVGGGMTAGAPGVLREGFAGSFRQAAEEHGIRTSRAVWELMRRGSLDLAAALRRYRIRCDLAPGDVIAFSSNTDRKSGLRREYEVRHETGIEGSWLTPAVLGRETALEAAGGIRTRGATIDPYRACAGLLAAAVARGARVYERSRVRRIRASKRHVDITTEGGSVRAETVIVATAAPIQDLRGLARHVRAMHTYGVVTEPLPAAVRKQVGKRAAVLEDVDQEGRIIRWLPDDRVFVHGAPQPEVPARARERALTQRTGQLMYELTLRYPAISGVAAAISWDGLDYDTVDGLPLIGPHRNYPHHFFAYGSARHGAGLAWTAARLALRHFAGETTRADEALGFQRVI